MFYLTTHSTHFIYGYMVSDIWLRTILIVRKETRCRHIGYSFWLTARVLLYAPSHRQDSTYHSLCYTSRGALAGTRNSSMGSPHEGSIRRPIAPWANALTTELHLAPHYITLYYYYIIIILLLINCYYQPLMSLTLPSLYWNRHPWDLSAGETQSVQPMCLWCGWRLWPRWTAPPPHWVVAFARLWPPAATASAGSHRPDSSAPPASPQSHGCVV